MVLETINEQAITCQKLQMNEDEIQSYLGSQFCYDVAVQQICYIMID